MKKVLLLMVACLVVSSVAMAHIGIYAEPEALTCTVAAGFNPSVYVIEKFIVPGSTGCRFKMDAPLGTILAFNTPWVPVGNIANDLSLAYGQCIGGTNVLGTALMSLTVGQVLSIQPADGFANIIYTDCLFGEYPTTGGFAYVGETGNCGEVATQPSTWGKVKSLYR